ncbi:hypothetical protein AHIS2_p096 [Acaryochloris phage A-HIS2]|nr:hypothetical protein AHIS2_p096 [Acaryochloris phage A-HIS2]
MTLQFYIDNRLHKITGECTEINLEYFVLNLQGVPTRFYFDCRVTPGEKPENGKFSILYVG